MASGGQQQRDELGRFVKEAGDSLREFSRGVQDSTRAVSENTKSKREEVEEQKARTDRINGFGSAASSALSAAITTGDADDGVSSLIRTGISAIRGSNIGGVHVGEFAAELSGLSRAERVLGTAADRTAEITSGLARYGYEVDAGFRERTLATAIEQEKRVEDERAKVMGEAFSPGNVGTIIGEQGQRLLDLVEKIANKIESLAGGGGG